MACLTWRRDQRIGVSRWTIDTSSWLMHASSETEVVHNGERKSVNIELRNRIAGEGVGEVDGKARATRVNATT